MILMKSWYTIEILSHTHSLCIKSSFISQMRITTGLFLQLLTDLNQDNEKSFTPALKEI